MQRKLFQKLGKSKRALTLPVTYLILFASLVTLISVTYSFAVVKIGERADNLKAVVAKQNMELLDTAVQEVAWSYGGSKSVYLDDCGGTFRTEINTNTLTINIEDGNSFNDTIFNDQVGSVRYEFDTTGLTYESDFLRGSPEAIANASLATTTQLYVDSLDHRQLILAYRPVVSAAVAGTANGKPLNLVRLYIISLNDSQTLVLSEKFHLRISSLSVSRILNQWEFNETIASLRIAATLGQTSNTIDVPISSVGYGAVVNTEVVLCRIRIQEPEV